MQPFTLLIVYLKGLAISSNMCYNNNIVQFIRLRKEVIMSPKEEFIAIYEENIKRPGADKLLEFLKKSDFFTAPSSTRFHGSYEGGLVQHSLNVYHCLKDYLSRPRTKEL